MPAPRPARLTSSLRFLAIVIRVVFTDLAAASHLSMSVGEVLIVLLHGEFLALPLLAGEVALLVHVMIRHPRLRIAPAAQPRGAHGPLGGSHSPALCTRHRLGVFT